MSHKLSIPCRLKNNNVQEAGPGADIGIKVSGKVREHDIVYKVVG